MNQVEVEQKNYQMPPREFGELPTRIPAMDRQSAARLSTGAGAACLNGWRSMAEPGLNEQAAPKMARSHPMSGRIEP